MILIYRMVVCVLIFSGAYLSADTIEKNDIEVVFHIATINNWKDVVRKQIKRLDKSGLGEVIHRLTVTVVGDEIQEVNDLFEKISFRKKVKIIHASHDLHQYEFPGIEKVIQIAKKNPNAKILYMHNKGVTHYQKPTEKAVKCWRRYMEYFTIDRWKGCIKALDKADICGVDWHISDRGDKFFAGNFWWATAAYISTCHLNYVDRFDCEKFIGTGPDPKIKVLHQSARNPIMTSMYPVEQYPEYYVWPPSSPYHVVNLYLFCFREKFYYL